MQDMIRAIAATLLSTFIFTLVYAQESSVSDTTSRTVRAIYLSESPDKTNVKFRALAEESLVHVQNWYKGQLDGALFKLNDPVIEVQYTTKPPEFYTSNPNGKEQRIWGMNNCKELSKKLFGARHFDPKYVWVVFVEGADFTAHGGSGFACLPEHVTRTSRFATDDLFRGVIAHELGHSLGLKHPEDMSKNNRSIMSSWGPVYYPSESVISANDKVKLQVNLFLYKDNVPTAGVVLGRYESMVDVLENRGQGVWFLFQKGTDIFLPISEVSSSSNEYVLRDENRGIYLNIPRAGGASKVSSDEQVTWKLSSKYKRTK